MFDFSDALEAVKEGKAIQRIGWNGKGMLVKAQMPDANSKMTLPYLYIEYPASPVEPVQKRCPWLASQTDIMAEDWAIFEDTSPVPIPSPPPQPAECL